MRQGDVCFQAAIFPDHLGGQGDLDGPWFKMICEKWHYFILVELLHNRMRCRAFKEPEFFSYLSLGKLLDAKKHYQIDISSNVYISPVCTVNLLLVVLKSILYSKYMYVTSLQIRQELRELED